MANQKRGNASGIHWRKTLGEKTTNQLMKISKEEERSITSQIRYFVKQGIKKYGDAHNLSCTGCGEVAPVCYCDIIDDNRKDTI